MGEQTRSEELASEVWLTLRIRVGVTLRHLLRGQVIAVLELVLSHSVPDRFGLCRLDHGDRPFEQGARVCKATSSGIE